MHGCLTHLVKKLAKKRRWSENVYTFVLIEILAYFNNHTPRRHSSLQQTSLASFLVIIVYFVGHIITEHSTPEYKLYWIEVHLSATKALGSNVCIVWGNTYDHNNKPLQRMKKKAIRLITFSNFGAHTSALFAQLKLLKLQDHIKLQTLYFAHQFVNRKLPKTFDSFFIKTSDKHYVNTHFATR